MNDPQPVQAGAELLPCPFCGGKATAWDRDESGNSPSVWCRDTTGCGAQVCIPDGVKADAIQIWNTRAALTDELTRLREKVGRMEDRFYIDCEFDGHNGPLLSIAIVGETHDGLHIETDFDEVMDPWVRDNVVPLMGRHEAPQSVFAELYEIGNLLRAYIGECQRPVIIADSPVDIGRFCQAISTGADGGWASADYPQMTFEVHNVDCYPTDLPGAVQHNAWWDAMALRQALADQPK